MISDQRRSMRTAGQTVVAGVALLVLLTPAPKARAQGVCSEPANRTLNCGLSVDISGWAQESGTSFLHTSEGHDAPGSIQIASQPLMGHEVSISQCIGGLSGIDRLYYGAWFQIVGGTVMSCNVSVSQFSDDNCTSFVDWDHYYAHDLTPPWTWAGGHIDLDPSVSGIRLYARCYSLSSSFIARIDDIHLGEGIGPLVFRDGVEEGDTAAWTSAVP